MARDLRRRTLLANRSLIAKVSVVYVAATTSLLWLLSMFTNPRLLWFFAGIALSSLAWMMHEFFGSVEYNRLRDGAFAEEFTARELSKLSGSGWAHIDHVEFHGCDVDHVAVGPGGVFAIETKWTTQTWTIDNGQMIEQWARSAVEQAATNARRIRALLEGNAKIRTDVQPVLMIWGPGRPHRKGAVTLNNGVLVASNSALRDHLRAATHKLTRDETVAISTAIEAFVSGKDAYDRQRATEHARPAAGQAQVSRS